MGAELAVVEVIPTVQADRTSERMALEKRRWLRRRCLPFGGAGDVSDGPTHLLPHPFVIRISQNLVEGQ